MRGVAVTPGGSTAGITVGIIVMIKDLVVMIDHAVERRMLTIMVAGIVTTVAGVAIVTDQASIAHITGITIVTPQTAPVRDIHTKGDDVHPLAWREIAVISTDHAEEIRRENHLKVIGEGDPAQ